MLQIAVYGKRQSFLNATETKSLTVKCFKYKIYSKNQKRCTDTLFNHRNLAVDFQ